MDQSPEIAEKLARLAAFEAEFQRLLEIEKLDAMAEFAAGAGHEINNPLTVISGRAQLLLRDEKDPERRHALALIVSQAMRVYEMIADMMLFARPPRPEFQAIELVAAVDAVVADLQPRCTRQETSLRRIGDWQPVVLQADPAQLNVALRALCQNALEVLGSGGQIEIALQLRPDINAAVIQVCDNGPGIKPEERRHLFDPFYSARQAGRGLGNGLSKVWRIVGMHGGRIEVNSQLGRGATFTITLPLSQATTPQVD